MVVCCNGAIVEKDWKTANLQKSAWLAKNSKKELHNVSQKAPNQFGLYDMYGNVWERVLDRGIKRGGSYATLDYYATWSPIQCERMMKSVIMTILDLDYY